MMQRAPANGASHPKIEHGNPTHEHDETTARIMEMLEDQFIENRHNWYLAKHEY